MPYFDWNEDKNKKLQQERDVSFEEVIDAIENGNLVDIIETANQKIHEGQKMFVVNIDDYIYLVPFVEDKQKIFLKTIFPSRKATKKYLKERRGI